MFEKEHKAGGILTYGIPDFRLNKQLVKDIIIQLKEMGIIIKVDTKILNVKDLQEQCFDAIFLAMGAEMPIRFDLDCPQNKNIITSNEILYPYNNGKNINLGNVAVIGGGNVAMDVARTAVKMNAKKVTILYRKNRELMPARDIEIEETLQDGVEIVYNTKVTKVKIKDDKISKIICRKTKFENEKLIEIENSDYEIKVDTLVFAIGFKPKILSSNIELENDLVKIDENGMTNIEGVFAGGDLTERKSTVCKAICAGKKAAIGIHKYLQ